MQSERPGSKSLEGKPLAILGPVLRPGDRAVEVILNDKGFDSARDLLASTADKVLLINVVSSLGAGICDAQTRRFIQEAAVLGDAYGTHIKELRIEQRSVFMVDKNGIVRYVEYVPKIAQHPNYDAALAAVTDLL